MILYQIYWNSNFIAYCARNFTRLLLLMFCRLCLGSWSDHGERTGGFYACNRYEAAKQEGVVWNKGIYIVKWLLIHIIAWSSTALNTFFDFFSKLHCASSMMKLRGGERWLRTPWKDTLIIMSGGLPTNRYAVFVPMSNYLIDNSCHSSGSVLEATLHIFLFETS